MEQIARQIPPTQSSPENMAPLEPLASCGGLRVAIQDCVQQRRWGTGEQLMWRLIAAIGPNDTRDGELRSDLRSAVYGFSDHGQHEAAVALAQGVLSATDGRPFAYALLINTLDKGCRFQEAAVVATEAVERFPKNENLRSKKVKALSRAGRYHEAYDAAKQAFNISSHRDPYVVNQLLRAMMKVGKFKDACRFGTKCIAWHPMDARIHCSVIEAFSKEGRFNDALALSTEARKKFPDDPHIVEAQAHAHLEKLDGRAACAVIESAPGYQDEIALSPAYIDALVLDGRTREAVQVGKKALVLLDSNVRPVHWMGLIKALWAHGDRDSALAAADMALEDFAGHQTLMKMRDSIDAGDYDLRKRISFR